MHNVNLIKACAHIKILQCHEAKKYHEKIENLNYDTSILGEHVFRLDGPPRNFFDLARFCMGILVTF